jgi:hypothetical protein
MYILGVIILLIPNSLFAENTTQTTTNGSLYEKALLDQQKKDAGNQVIIKLLQSFPSAYKISVLNQQIKDNGDNTANITFQVNLEFDCSVTPDEKRPMEYGQYYHHVSKMPGIDLNELWSSGLDITSNYPYSPPSFKKRVNLKCKEPMGCKEIMDFVCQETQSKPLFLYMTAGQQHSVKKQLSFSTCKGPFKEVAFDTGLDKRLTFTIKNIPLPELKDISTVQAKVLYLDRSAFPKNDRDFIGSN